jgi:LacI family transcriptional regulator
MGYNRKDQLMPDSTRIMLLINPSRGYTRGLLSGIARYAHLRASWTFYRPLEYRDKVGRSIVQILRKLKPDGIFMREPPGLRRIINMGVPIVCSAYTREAIPGVASIVTDQEAIGRMAAEHLLTQGLRHFAYCTFDDWWWSRRRRDSFAQRVAEAGLEMFDYEVPAAGEQRLWDKELPLIAAWLQRLPKPVGIMGCNDDRGALIIDACKLVGLRVPDEVAVVGVDNDELVCDLCSPPLSSVATSLGKAGYEAAALLDRMIQGKEKGKPTLCIQPTHVVARQSTDLLAVDDPAIVSALRFIRRHGRRDLGVQEVADQAGLSRRLLEKRFRRLVGHSIHREIQRVRADFVTRMLLETHMPISEIAEVMQFTDVAHLARFFREEKGCSPTQYRLQHAV